METTDTVEPEEMNGRVLGIIGAYGMGAPLDPHQHGTTPADTPGAPPVDEPGDSGAEATEEPRVRKIA
jgi:hypothetical protein